MYSRILVILLFSSICLGEEGKWITYGPRGVSISSLSYSHSWGDVWTPTICAGSDSQGVFFFDFDRKEWFSQNEGLTDHRIISVAPWRTPFQWILLHNGFFISTKDSGVFAGSSVRGWGSYNKGLISLKSSLLSSGSFISFEYLSASLYAVVNDTEIFVRHYCGIPSSDSSCWQRMKWIGLKCSAIHTQEAFPIILYVGVIEREEGELWKTTNEGENWKEILNIKTGKITSIASPTDSTIYVATDYGTVYKSSDGGASWDSSSLPIPIPILSLLASGPDSVYVGTLNKGVYQSTDGGKTWREMNQELIPKKVNSLDKVGNTLYAGTPDGVWEYTIPQGISERREPFKNIRMEISPNPVKKSTGISLQLPMKETINLKVYDATGRLIKTLVKAQSLEPKTYTIKWDGRDEKGNLLPSGVYFVRLETKGVAKTEKVILTR